MSLMKAVVENSSGLLWREDWDFLKENMGKFIHRRKPLEVRVV